MTISKDAVNEFKRLISKLFQKNVSEQEGYPVKPDWILLPIAAYTVLGPEQKRSMYKLRNVVLEPVHIPGPHSKELDTLELVLEQRARDLTHNQELGLNTSVVVGWSNGVVGCIDLEVYDGAPSLKSVPPDVLAKFNVLRTNNSFHFYAKDRAKQIDLGDCIDKDWLTFKRLGAGYIRVSQNGKGRITASAFGPAQMEVIF